jgi:integrase
VATGASLLDVEYRLRNRRRRRSPVATSGVDHRDEAVFAARKLSRGVRRAGAWESCPRLRHTTASLAISAGANVKVVQRLLGHATASMTLDRQKEDELALNTR